jgi:hypothetical protein
VVKLCFVNNFKSIWHWFIATKLFGLINHQQMHEVQALLKDLMVYIGFTGFVNSVPYGLLLAP